jgi:hypothetical protein
MKEAYFWDNKSQEVVSLDLINDYWNDMEEQDQAEYGFQFENYVESLQYYNGGTLEEMDEDQVRIYLAEEARDWYEDLNYRFGIDK